MKKEKKKEFDFLNFEDNCYESRIMKCPHCKALFYISKTSKTITKVTK